MLPSTQSYRLQLYSNRTSPITSPVPRKRHETRLESTITRSFSTFYFPHMYGRQSLTNVKMQWWESTKKRWLFLRAYQNHMLVPSLHALPSLLVPPGLKTLKSILIPTTLDLSRRKSNFDSSDPICFWTKKLRFHLGSSNRLSFFLDQKVNSSFQ